MSGFVEGRYDPGTLLRNRIVVGLLVVGAITACILGASLTDWPWPNALGMMAVAGVFGAILWWMFASRKAGPVRLSKRSQSDLKRTFWMR